ncbi:hypothetical protein [Methanoregula sp.]|uniref:hypothetical protein n=1 Tax=Methanoregula sp. TaxID=2052170 RepID=UPI003BB0CDAE
MLSREEQQEYAGFIEAQVRDLSLVRKIGRKVRNLFVSRARLDDLRGRLIRETEPFFADYVRKLSGNDDFKTELQIRYFEKRIRTLPRDTLLRLYDEYERIARVRSEKVREKLLDNFCNSISLSYSLNGWFLHIYADELKKRP